LPVFIDGQLRERQLSVFLHQVAVHHGCPIAPTCCVGERGGATFKVFLCHPLASQVREAAVARCALLIDVQLPLEVLLEIGGRLLL
jgi:hypothetical protein